MWIHGHGGSVPRATPISARFASECIWGTQFLQRASARIYAGSARHRGQVVYRCFLHSLTQAAPVPESEKSIDTRPDPNADGTSRPDPRTTAWDANHLILKVDPSEFTAPVVERR